MVLIRRLNFNFLTRWRLSGPVAAELLVAPQDLATADPTLASDIYAGYFSLGGYMVNCAGQSPFDLDDVPSAWFHALHEFGWLKHLRAAETSVSRTQARLYIEDWMRSNNKVRPVIWDAERTAKRVIAWLCHSPLILEDCDHAFYRRFMRSITRQVRYLRLVAADAAPGMPRLLISIALSYAAICMSGHPSFIKNSTKRLSRELNSQILPDGGHISRNPSVIITVLSLLMPLRQAIIARDVLPSDELNGAIDRMMPMLRFFRLGDGALGKFNGAGDTPTDLVGTMLAHDEVGSAPILNAVHSGYQRLVGNDVAVLVDTGGLPAMNLTGDMHAGCLSFELSFDREKIVTNCGHIEDDQPASATISRIARSTATHSTLTINEQSSCLFAREGRFNDFLGRPVLSGPKSVNVTRTLEEDAVVIDADHDGYVSGFDVKHRRVLALANNGVALTGRDVVMTGNDEEISPGNSNTFQIRFHLHHQVDVTLSSPRTVELRLPSGRRWLFACVNTDIEIEETVSFSKIYGTKPSKQMLVQGVLGEISTVEWAFQQLS